MRMAHGQNRISAQGGDRTGEASDAASFTTARIVSGALVLVLLLIMRGSVLRIAGNWSTAFWLFAYAACSSFAYTGRSAGTGARLLFGAAGFTPARSAARLIIRFTARDVGAPNSLIRLAKRTISEPSFATS